MCRNLFVKIAAAFFELNCEFIFGAAIRNVIDHAAVYFQLHMLFLCLLFFRDYFLHCLQETTDSISSCCSLILTTTGFLHKWHKPIERFVSLFSVVFLPRKNIVIASPWLSTLAQDKLRLEVE